MPELCTVWEATLADSVTALRWDPGGYRLAAGSLGGDIVVFGATGGFPRSSAGRGEGISAMAWSSDGRWLAVGDHGSTLTIMGPKGLVVETPLAGWASAAAWAPDRAEVAVAAGLGVTVVDASARLTAEYPMHPGRVNDVAWHPASGDLLVASVGGIRFYDPGAPGMEPTALAPRRARCWPSPSLREASLSPEAASTAPSSSGSSTTAPRRC